MAYFESLTAAVDNHKISPLQFVQTLSNRSNAIEWPNVVAAYRHYYQAGGQFTPAQWVEQCAIAFPAGVDPIEAIDWFLKDIPIV
ncbi:MAG: hypothetical protein AB1489_41080 [Acidobacteriota bacterium]